MRSITPRRRFIKEACGETLIEDFKKIPKVLKAIEKENKDSFCEVNQADSISEEKRNMETLF